MASAGSLDEVIEVHEAYLLSIQRQCFVVPDKLWMLIANRTKSILRLALEFYSVQQTLSSGGTALAIKARCEMEVDRIEKQFDDCIAFLLRVLSYKLNVGHFPHLADLVTKINYNYFYMSDSGSMLTVPGSETSGSRLGKGFPVRPTCLRNKTHVRITIGAFTWQLLVHLLPSRSSLYCVCVYKLRLYVSLQCKRERKFFVSLYMQEEKECDSYCSYVFFVHYIFRLSNCIECLKIGGSSFVCASGSKGECLFLLFVLF